MLLVKTVTDMTHLLPINLEINLRIFLQYFGQFLAAFRAYAFEKSIT